MEDIQARGTRTYDRERLSGRLEEFGWAALLLMSGAIMAVPGLPHPWAIWFVGVGAILLGLNLARSANGIRVNLMTAGFGGIALAAGVGAFVGLAVPILALCLILGGVLILVGPLTRKQPQPA